MATRNYLGNDFMIAMVVIYFGAVIAIQLFCNVLGVSPFSVIGLTIMVLTAAIATDLLFLAKKVCMSRNPHSINGGVVNFYSMRDEAMQHRRNDELIGYNSERGYYLIPRR